MLGVEVLPRPRAGSTPTQVAFTVRIASQPGEIWYLPPSRYLELQPEEIIPIARGYLAAVARVDHVKEPISDRARD